MAKDEKLKRIAPSPWARRLLEAGFFVVVIAVLWTVDTLTKFNLRNVQGFGLDDFRLIVQQMTSATAVLLLVPATAWWLGQFPLEKERWLSAIAGHVIGSALFATAHYFLSVGMRWAIHSAYGVDYVFSDFWLNNLIVEYQKDIKVYFGIVAIVAAYRYYRRNEAATVSAKPGRLIVQTGNGETVIRESEIEYLEAARNYVVVGTESREYLVRDTLRSLERSVAPDQLVRTHRSYLVNVDRIEEIRTTDSGGREIRMQSGKLVPLSRGYKDTFRDVVRS